MLYSCKIQMDAMNEEEWINRKKEIGRSYILNLQTTNYDSNDSVPERSSSLWSEISAPSLSPRRIYTPLPDLLCEAENQHCGDKESYYRCLKEKILKYMSKTPDSLASSGTYEEESYQQFFNKEENQNETKISSNDTSQSIETRQCKRTRNSEGIESPLGFKPKRSKVDVHTQTFSSDDEISSTSRKSDFTTRRQVRLDLKQEKLLIGDIKIFNICACKKHKCK